MPVSVLEARVREVELRCFTPLVFCTSGGLGPAAKTFYKRLASLIAEKHDQPCSLTLSFASCQIELFVATFCNHVSSWLKILIPSRRMLPTRLCHRSVLLSRQKCLMFCLYALMFVYVIYILYMFIITMVLYCIMMFVIVII